MVVVVLQTEDVLVLEMENTNPDQDLREFYTPAYLEALGLSDVCEVYFHRGEEKERESFRKSLVKFGGYFQPVDELTHPYKEFVNLVEGTESDSDSKEAQTHNLDPNQSWFRKKPDSEKDVEKGDGWKFRNPFRPKDKDPDQEEEFVVDDDKLLERKRSKMPWIPSKQNADNDADKDGLGIKGVKPWKMNVGNEEDAKDLEEKEKPTTTGILSFQPTKIQDKDSPPPPVVESSQKKMNLPKKEYLVLKFTLRETTLEEPHGRLWDQVKTRDRTTDLECNPNGLVYDELWMLWELEKKMQLVFPENGMGMDLWTKNAHLGNVFRINGKGIFVLDVSHDQEDLEEEERIWIKDLDWKTGLDGTWLATLRGDT